MFKLILASCLIAICSRAVDSAPYQSQFAIRPSQRMVRCSPPLRTLPRLDSTHGTRNFRADREFLREWCRPALPVLFPQLPTPQLKRPTRRPSPSRGYNPYRGTAVEGGSQAITFPGQHLNHQTPSRRPRNEVFLNSKMHPSLLRPSSVYRQRLRRRWN